MEMKDSQEQKSSLSQILPPLFSSPIAAGFSSWADDLIDKKLDLNERLISHPSATFFVKVVGDSMIGAGIFEGDILIVDRALEAKDGKIIIAVVNGEFTVKRLKFINNFSWLMPENPKYKPVKIMPESNMQIFGVVTYAIHDVRSY